MSDLRFALRMIRSHGWFSAAVIVTLAVGIGINTMVFTLSGAVLFQPLPFRDSDRLVTVNEVNAPRNIRRLDLSYDDLTDLRSQATSFELLEASTRDSGVISEPDRPAERVRMARVTGGFFRVFRMEPAAGRIFGPADMAADAPDVAVIGYNLWRNRYQLAAGVVGAAISINGRPTTIVGVMPQGFGMPELEELWVPLRPGDPLAVGRDNRRLMTFGLLAPGQSMSSAAADLNAIALRLQQAYPNTNKDITASVMGFHERFVGGKARTMFTLMLGAVGLVLVVACANVANMMLSRTVGRRREMTIRSALGASRWRIVRQLLVECLVLSSAGGLLGLLLASLGVPAFDRALVVAEKPSWIVFSFNGTVLAYVAAVCVGSAVLFGLAPALRSSRVDLADTLKQGGRGGSGRVGLLSGTLVIVQFALAVVLLAAAGLLIRSLMAGNGVNPWFPGESIMAGRLDLPASRYADAGARSRFFETALTKLAATPGVEHAAVGGTLPALGSGTTRFEIEGRASAPDERPFASLVPVSTGYFAAINLAIVKGRPFQIEDGQPGREAAVVSRTFAAKHWPQEEPIGKRIRPNGTNPSAPWLTVVGVTDDLVQSTQDALAAAVIFVPYQQSAPTSLMLIARASRDPAGLASVLRTMVRDIDPDLALYRLNTADALVRLERWPYRVFGSIFGIFALSTLMMASIGLYAVMAQSTGRRRREIGIRVALGATPGRILRAILRRGVLQLAAGLVLGLVGAYFVTGTMGSLLLGVLPGDPGVFASASILLAAVGLIACWIPAHRAARIQPMRVLGSDESA